MDKNFKLSGTFKPMFECLETDTAGYILRHAKVDGNIVNRSAGILVAIKYLTDKGIKLTPEMVNRQGENYERKTYR